MQKCTATNWRETMNKLESMTFAVGMMLSGLLMFATLAPVA